MGRIAGVSPDQTRERLLDAAARVFELRGYEGATVSEIAREAGVTSGAIYAHYTSKAELLVDALRVHSERATASVLPPGTCEHGTTALLVEALLPARRDAEVARVLVAALGRRERHMAALIAKGRLAGHLAGDMSPDATARLALTLSLGSMLVRSLDMPVTDPAEWSSFIDRLVGRFDAT